MSTISSPLSIDGTRQSGDSVRTQNVTAALAIANIVKSSLGPVGLDKMLVDDIGDVTITNDGATILRLLEVEHPAAKVLVELAQLQDAEVGDGTTSVVLLAAELLQNADELVKQNIHPTSIISGYRLACREACKFISERMTVPVESLNRESVVSIARTAIGSKIIGADADFFANMIVSTGVNVVFCSGGVDDLCMKYFVEAGAMAVRRVKKNDLMVIARATGATFLSSLTNLDGEESFDASMVGEAAEVVEERICDDDLILIKGPKARAAVSIILRGPTDSYCDEMERSVHDALSVVKRVLESKKVVAGGGCIEAALSIYLEGYATSLSSREQLAIMEFAKSMLVIPKTLAVNAAQDATELVARLRAFHNSSLNNPTYGHLKWVGLNLTDGVVRDNKKAGVLEPAISKIKSLKFATEAAITILRIDDMIKLNPEDKSTKTYDDACAAGELDG
ncbi:T-complex protein 1 subunit alpha-like isoform X2 [Drosophila navojoa]|uniref:T-complex protein 1 subunit alpha-like isoform X2 n=1 Tax=Drosophila navojoa TaxID=7232 RepID=UPI0008475A9A|nr:T-complex protein 1 subunit alpha-like isoform X2 [Drosophila navojoa]